MAVKYVLLSERLVGSALEDGLVADVKGRRVEVRVLADMPSGLDGSDVWIAASRLSVLYVGAEEVLALADDATDGWCRRVAAFLSPSVGRVGEPASTSSGASSSSSPSPPSRGAAARTKVVLVECYPCTNHEPLIDSGHFQVDASSGASTPERRRYRLQQQQARQRAAWQHLQSRLLEQFHAAGLENDVSGATHPGGASADALRVHFVADVRGSVEFIRRAAYDIPPSDIDELPPRHPMRGASSSSSLSSSSITRWQRALALVPGIGEKKAAAATSSAAMNRSPLLHFSEQSLRDVGDASGRATAAALHRFLHRPALPSAHSADAVLYADAKRHWHTWFPHHRAHTS
ncbi:hypothetical protein CDCA_CDCA05G1612 [Cyanidium caldarium]|uniref:Uncharacterized protein n=1 Tax=Cyanidium caldarium TaxID=2771 RepID=A0AAV9ITE1_CYACA|nr:hypothetical protein CDCA_CDCA05G1612 [Cyanidium caldarium]